MIQLATRQRPRRWITGMSAVLLPYTEDGRVDWAGFEAHLARTVEAGLVPAVNMDTGYAAFIGPAMRTEVLAVAARVVPAGGPDRFLAAAVVDDAPGDAYDHGAHVAAAGEVAAAGGTPIMFPSFGLAGLSEEDLVAVHQQLGTELGRFFGFELGPMFHPAGRIWELDTFEAMVSIPQLVGIKHSSLRRGPELERLGVRDRLRPEFMVLSGNDLAIDQVVYGSDYLLGLSTFSPEAFAARDAAWAAGDEVRFWELNDLLQYLGQFAFRPPVPAYRHDAAMFLHGMGLVASERTHPNSPTRPATDRDVLADVARRLTALLGG